MESPLPRWMDAKGSRPELSECDFPHSSPQRHHRRSSSMIVFYREGNSDVLAIDTTTNAYYRKNLGKDHFEGRATAIAGQVGSVCTTAVSREYLKARCRRVAKRNVSMEWRNAIGM